MYRVLIDWLIISINGDILPYRVGVSAMPSLSSEEVPSDAISAPPDKSMRRACKLLALQTRSLSVFQGIDSSNKAYTP